MYRRILKIAVLLLVLISVITNTVPGLAAGDAEGTEPGTTEAVTKEALKTELLAKEPYASYDSKTWESKTVVRDIDHLPDERLEELTKYYPEKINRLAATLTGVKDSDQIASTDAEIARLKDKFILVCNEIEARKTGVKREIHHTIYYIDLNAGDDSKNGLTTGNAWKTIGKYTTTTVRTAGDIAYVRAGTTQIPTADIVFDEDGTLAAPISIIGCDATTNDPWSDDSDVRPIIDFNDAVYGFDASVDDFWVITRLDVRQSADTNGNFYVSTSDNWVFNDCIFRESSAGNFARGLNISSPSCIINSCQFYDNSKNNLVLYNCAVTVNSCVFNGGTDTTDYGIVLSHGVVYLYNCSFGATTQHDVSTFSLVSSQVYSVNSLFSDSSLDTVNFTIEKIFSQDHNQVKGASYSLSIAGVIQRDSTISLDSLNSAKMSPVSDITNREPLTLSQTLSNDYAIWCPASETTITIKARETAAWAADPTADEFYFEASYLNHATAATRSTVKSAQTLSGTTEVAFTMTFTPSAAGWVYVTCYLKDYEAGKSVNVSIKPVATY